MEEIWKDIAGYEGKYQVSNLGRVRSLDQQLPFTTRWGTIAYRLFKGKVLTAHNLRGGYLGALFKVQGHTEMKLVHRLVANAFVPNPQNLETVNHIDEDKTNNRADNLEWMSRADNVRYGTGTIRKRREKTAVIQMDLDGNTLRTFDSIKEASEATGVDPSCISGCVRGCYGCVTAGGFKWKSINPIKKRKRR